MAVVTIHVPDKLKREMKQFDVVNWSAVLRKHIKEEIEEQKWRIQMDNLDPEFIEELKKMSKQADEDYKAGKIKATTKKSRRKMFGLE